MDPAEPGKTVGGMDAAVKRTGMYLQRVLTGSAGPLLQPEPLYLPNEVNGYGRPMQARPT